MPAVVNSIVSNRKTTYISYNFISIQCLRLLQLIIDRFITISKNSEKYQNF